MNLRLFAIYLPSIPKSQVFCLAPPSSPRMSRATFYVIWHCILKFVTLIQGTGGGGPSPKVRVFCRSRWPDTSKILNKPLPISRKNRKRTIIKRCSEWDRNPSNALSSFLTCSVDKGAPWGIAVANPEFRWILNLAPQGVGGSLFFFISHIFIFLT